jgi:hypothetical protein
LEEVTFSLTHVEDGKVKLRRRPVIGEQQNVLIRESFRECVAFLCVDVRDEATGVMERKPAATAFFVAVPIENNAWVYYAVTARHVLDQSQRYGPLYLRLNTKDSFEDIEVPQDVWVTHPETDVAVALTSASLSERYAINALRLDNFVTDEFAREHNIGEGDEVFFVGLFVNYWGAERAQPIVRFGNISLKTRGKVPLKLNPYEDPVPVDAYLVEARSWGGHSGAPVFISFTPTRELLVSGQLRRKGHAGLLLGLVQGHFDVKTDVEFIGDIMGSGTVSQNAGIAAVIPAQKIIDTLLEEELEEEREILRQRWVKQRPSPTPDAELPDESY